MGDLVQRDKGDKLSRVPSANRRRLFVAKVRSYCASAQRDGQAELTWVAGYITEMVYPATDHPFKY